MGHELARFGEYVLSGPCLLIDLKTKSYLDFDKVSTGLPFFWYTLSFVLIFYLVLKRLSRVTVEEHCKTIDVWELRKKKPSRIRPDIFLLFYISGRIFYYSASPISG